MKPFLLYREGEQPTQLPANEPDITKDLNLRLICEAMGHGDDYIRIAASKLLPRQLRTASAVRYRQEILRECLKNQYTINKIYTVCSSAAEDAAAYRSFTKPNYAQVVSSAVRLRTAAGLLELLLGKLRELANIASENTRFSSEGLYGFCLRVNSALNTGFFAEAHDIIIELKAAAEQSGMIIGGHIGQGLKGADYALRRVSGTAGISFSRRRYKISLKDYLVTANAKDAEEAGFVHMLRVVANFITLITSFMEQTRQEISFYVGCINLYRWMDGRSLPLCIPEVSDYEEQKLSFDGLYDLSIAIADNISPVGNTLNLDGKRLMFVTGANQGGKSTFLRSAGIAYIMAQAGMFVPAASMTMSVKNGLYTHFARAEDASMDNGKLAEELERMSDIVDMAVPGSIVLMNEAFATTTEREGALIGAGILSALHELDITVIYVTHLYELADNFYAKKLDTAEYLLAQRMNDGSRSFKILPGRPRETSYGEDLYEKIIVRRELDPAPLPDEDDER